MEKKKKKNVTKPRTRDGFSGGFKTLNYSFFLKKNVCPIVFQCAQWEKCDAQNVAFQMMITNIVTNIHAARLKWTSELGGKEN